MEVVYVIAGIAIAVMLAELLLPTGGVLAVIGAGGLVGAGIIALGFSIVDRLTLWRRDRSELLLVGTTLLGLGLLAVGLFLYLS